MPKKKTKMGAKERLGDGRHVRFGVETWKKILAYNKKQDGEAVATSIRRLVIIGLSASDEEFREAGFF